MNILLIHQAFFPDPAGAARVLYELCVQFTRDGHHVTVVTGNQTYSTGEPLPLNDTVEGIRIIRVPTPGGRRSALQRLRGMLTFTWNACRYALQHAGGFDLIVASTLPPFVAAPVSRIAAVKGLPFVYVCHDIFPDLLVRSGTFRGMTARVLSVIMEYQNRVALRHASRTIVLSEGMKRLVARKLPSAEPRMVIIPNFADPDRIWQTGRDNPWAVRHGLHNKRVVLYAGNMGLSHNLELLLDAAAHTRGSDLQYVFVGSGQKRAMLERRVREESLENVTFLPFQPEEQLSDLLGTAFVSVIALEPELEGVAVPSKLYSILASGRPCLVLQPQNCEIAGMVLEYGVGYNAESVQEILQATDELADPQHWNELSRRARSLFEERFSIGHVVAQYEAAFEQAVELGPVKR